MTTPLARFVAPLALSAFALWGSSCGIPLDDQPRAIAAVGAEAARPTPSTAPGGSAAYVYLATDDHLVPVEHEVGGGTVAERITALLALEPTALETSSQVPGGTRLLGVERSASIVTIDLSKEFDNLQGVARRLAAAQLVFTATESSGVEDVLFKVNGRTARVDSPVAGDTDRVRACDYLSLLPTTEQLAAAEVDDSATRHVTRRRSSLEQRCPDAKVRATDTDRTAEGG